MVLDEDDKSQIKFINNKFFLGSFRMSFQEKAQITETFGSANISFFNDTVKIYNFAGQAVDFPSMGNGPEKSMNGSSLTQMYNKHLRGTQLVKNKSIMLLKVFNHMVYGYPISFNTSYSSAQDKLSSYAFQMVVTKHTQNLPGLFETEDLEDQYAVKNVVFGEEDSFRMGIIIEFEEAIEENLKVAEDILDNDGIRIHNFLFSEDSLSDLNLRVQVLARGDAALARDVKSRIRKGLNGFLSHLNSTKDSRFSSALGINTNVSSSGPGTLAENLSNGGIDNMFDNVDSWDLVKSFLSEIRSLQNKLSVIKTSIQLKGQ